MVGFATSFRLALVTSTTLLLRGSASRIQSPESTEEVSCAFATTFQVKNLIGMRTSKGNGLVAAAQTEINQMAELCEKEDQDLKTIARFSQDVPDLGKKIRDTRQKLKEADKSLSEFESSNRDVTDSACSDASKLAGNIATFGRVVGNLFKKADNDPDQRKAIEAAKKMSKRCAAGQKLKATVERLTKEIPKLEEEKENKEMELVSLKGGLPERAKAIKHAREAAFAEIQAIFSGSAEATSSRKSRSPKNGRNNRKRRSL